MDEIQKLAIPNRIDDPAKFAWWDFDVAILFMAGVVFGLMTNFPFTGVIVGLVMGYALQKAKAGRHKAFGLHMLYWYMGMSFGMRNTPGSWFREFVGK